MAFRIGLEPSYSCPHLDSAISEIENARKIHESLRSWGRAWEEKAGDLEVELKNTIEEKDNKIRDLELRIEDLELELLELKENKPS